MRASKGVVAQAESMRRNRAARDARERDAAQEIAARLEGRRISIPARAGEGGKLFGSITVADVAEAVSAAGEADIDRKAITLDEPLKELGEVELPVRLHAEVTATVTIEVVAE
jgi:large subunit ribosomal protein L9